MAEAATQGATRSWVEVERKYDVHDREVPLPDLRAVPGVGAVSPPEEHLLEAVYYDTPDWRLRAAGITLRHRTGGTDAGWHLKLPAGRGREEISADGAAGDVPHPLATLVRSRTRSAHLAPVATVSTRRVVQRLLDDAGRPLAEVSDDTVTGRRVPGNGDIAWREWEVELLAGDEGVLDEVETHVLASGARPSASASKLARLLPRPSSEDGARPWWAVSGKGGRLTAGAAVQAHLAEQVAELVARDPYARRNLPDGLHKMRVATRRLRSALSTFRPLLERERTDPLRAELRWLAGVLGAARDAEVMHARLRRLVAAEPTDLVLGKVQDRIDASLLQRHRAAHDRVLAELDGERYLRLLDALDELVAQPPFQPKAGGEASEVLPRMVRRTWRRLDRRMAAAQDAPRGPVQDELLHEVRKDAKRTRYAAEAVQPVFGKPAARYAASVAELQESLGDFQDGVVTREVLRELGARGHLAGQNGFTFGRLHAFEQVKAEAAVDAWPHARAVVSRRRLRRWFDG